MPSYPVRPDESARLEALRRYRLLDAGRDAALDDLVAIASQLCGTPISLVTLLAEETQRFLAKTGMEAEDTPREVAFCNYAIMQKDVLEVDDATADPRFADNPLVTGGPQIRFYAGAPIHTVDGHAVGTLCVIDTVPRTLGADQREALAALGRMASRMLALRHTADSLADALEQVRELSGLLPICAYCKSIRDDAGYWRQVEQYLGAHTDTSFSHGICPTCMARHFPDTAARE